MAIYHFEVSIIGRKAKGSAVAAAAYRAGEKIHDEKAGVTYDYTRKKGVLYSEIITPENAPDWANDRSKLWNSVEASEKRNDSQVIREIMVALPKELDSSQRIKLVKKYVLKEFVSKGMIVDFSIHAPSKKSEDECNFHTHISLTTRNITPEGFGGKAREWNSKSSLCRWRKEWENHTNQALEQAGFDCRVDGRSHASKGLDQEPRLHLGVQAMALERKGIQSDRGNENRAIESRNDIRAKLRELDEINDEIDKILQGKSEQQAGIKTPETVTNLAGSTLCVF